MTCRCDHGVTQFSTVERGGRRFVIAHADRFVPKKKQQLRNQVKCNTDIMVYKEI